MDVGGEDFPVMKEDALGVDLRINDRGPRACIGTNMPNLQGARPRIDVPGAEEVELVTRFQVQWVLYRDRIVD